MKILSFDVGIVNLAYCIFDTTSRKILHWEVITLENTTDHCKLHVNLILALDSRKFLRDVDTVLIEKQPSFNPKMRIISGCLQTYFFIRGVIDANPDKKIKVIKFFSPKHKLKCYNGPVVKFTKGSKYSNTKKMGIIICREKLNQFLEDSTFKEMFENSKKKDDLADSYLQAVTYSIFEKLIQNIQNNPVNNGNNTNNPVNNGNNGNNVENIEVLTKAKIKKRVKEIFQTNEVDSSIFNLFDSVLQKSLKEKYNITFPLTDITSFLTEFNMKRLIPQFNQVTDG
jgi:hypothetical protein